MKPWFLALSQNKTANYFQVHLTHYDGNLWKIKRTMNEKSAFQQHWRKGLVSGTCFFLLLVFAGKKSLS